ncbi:hypothetical protein Kpho02_68980 [Kitasatospora phosalacinea]|uniref:Uncharacterized protein n=1 Tax=Kitasatospora phosalacinea TaxID=2065 RepID=A0A9W6V6W7_9ACTN|nr:hypothetical protein [Kitasatospora phosalacinea]GLW74600.1 hypothetical protein Kpho02_68980 [Kitasatospora phosalacinea]
MSSDIALPVPGWNGGDGNNAYLDKTLRHMPVETVLDDRVSGRALLRMAARALLVSWMVWLAVLLFGLLIALADSSSGSDRYGSSDPTDFLSVPFYAGLVGFATFLVVLLVGKLTEPIAEWRVLLHARADVDSAYNQICNVVAERGYPLAPSVEAAQQYGGVSRGLVLAQHDCTAHVSVFSYGSSLYLGWQMWRTRSKFRLFVQFVTDNVSGGSDLRSAMSRTGQVRAMREAVHAACREGLVVAIEQRPVQLQVQFPQASSVSTVKAVGPQRLPSMPPAPPGAAPVPPAPPAPPGPWAADEPGRQ